MDGSTAQSVRLEINSLKNLPALPEASLRILEAINTPDIPIDTLAASLALSPGLVARLLGLANSAYFARGKHVADIHAAIFQVLGLDLVKSLSLAIVFNVHFDTGRCESFDTEYFWTRSLLTAVTAQKLAAETPLTQTFSPSTIYTCGLLLDLGILVLGFLAPERLHAIFSESHQKGLTVGELIVRDLGQSHFQLGYFLLQKWRLPDLYQNVLQQYESAEESGELLKLVSLMRICRQLSACLVKGKPIDSIDFAVAEAQLELSSETIASIAETLLASQSEIEMLASIMGRG